MVEWVLRMRKTLFVGAALAAMLLKNIAAKAAPTGTAPF